MARWIETSQPLLQGEMHAGDRGDHDLAALYRNTNPLIDAQMRLARDRCGQSNTEIIAPLLNIENGFGHD